MGIFIVVLLLCLYVSDHLMFGIYFCISNSHISRHISVEKAGSIFFLALLFFSQPCGYWKLDHFLIQNFLKMLVVHSQSKCYKVYCGSVDFAWNILYKKWYSLVFLITVFTTFELQWHIWSKYCCRNTFHLLQVTGMIPWNILYRSNVV